MAGGWRYEIKLPCPAHRLSQARSWVRTHPAGFNVAYPPRWVSSLYLDTRQLNNLNDHLAGVYQRQKLRLRWYGDQWADTPPVIELKRRVNQLGSKRQYPLPRPLDLTAPWPQVLAAIRAQVELDWRVLLQTIEQPTLFTGYQREYYVTPDGNIRITLDYDQVAYDQRLTPRFSPRIPLPITDMVVIEIKTSQHHARRLHEIATWFPVRCQRNSKYINGLLKNLM
ncbi:MAG TPA: polyphosphate polymerase domain-containing protein [Chloroflexi bacterium]|nr:polyphosphate polymerase domain-containing protein [Chloroflexota bacterium]